LRSGFGKHTRSLQTSSKKSSCKERAAAKNLEHSLTILRNKEGRKKEVGRAAISWPNVFELALDKGACSGRRVPKLSAGFKPASSNQGQKLKETAGDAERDIAVRSPRADDEGIEYFGFCSRFARLAG